MGDEVVEDDEGLHAGDEVAGVGDIEVPVQATEFPFALVGQGE